MRGIFITFEGADGVGKTTQMEMLFKALTRRGHSIFVTREPGGTEVGEKLRKILKTESIRPIQALILINDLPNMDYFLQIVIKIVSSITLTVILKNRFIFGSKHFCTGARHLAPVLFCERSK